MRKMPYKQMREQGMCTCCGSINITPDKSLCPACRERKSIQRKENRAYRRKIGVCTRCGKNPAEPHGALCFECLGAENDKYTKKKTDKSLERYYKRKDSGLCTRCGKNERYKGLLCKRCYSKVRIKKQAKKHDILRSERPDYGLCYICGNRPIFGGYKVCKECYEVRLKTIPAMLAVTDRTYFLRLNTLIFNNRKEK